ncbi:trypsin-2-like isoform X1 [Harmonia axyridis]|uniref:trypsin-2-like isoform X1 n=1 Tax=Harmonia axyridis TaxID=115357 RepID=UPI001E278004|nr:trypsin-2-like isoform X1 [Harmonia axyridis]
MSLLTLLGILFVAEISDLQESRKRNPRIVGGTKVESRLLYPFQVSVRYRTEHVCGGTIIHPRFILTAAHCAYNQEKVLNIQEFTIIVGDLSVYEWSNSTIYRDVWKRHQHPRYFSTLIQNDIALLELSKPLEESPFVKSISISESMPPYGTICKISGWGLTNEKKETPLVATPYLMEIQVSILPSEDCYRFFSWFSYDNSKICGYSAQGCPKLGDSGGPLICNGQLFGVISFGKKHHCVQSANCFTSTKYHYNWIQYIISRSENNRRYGNIFTFGFSDILGVFFKSMRRILA